MPLRRYLEMMGYNTDTYKIKYIQNRNPWTIVHWQDGTITRVKCGEGDTYDAYTGFMAALTKKVLSGVKDRHEYVASKDYNLYLEEIRRGKEQARQEHERQQRKAFRRKVRREKRRLLAKAQAKEEIRCGR